MQYTNDFSSPVFFSLKIKKAYLPKKDRLMRYAKWRLVNCCRAVHKFHMKMLTVGK